MHKWKEHKTGTKVFLSLFLKMCLWVSTADRLFRWPYDLHLLVFTPLYYPFLWSSRSQPFFGTGTGAPMRIYCLVI